MDVNIDADKDDLLYDAFEDPHTFILGSSPESSGERVRELLQYGERAPELFVEATKYDVPTKHWLQTARWIRYKEAAELESQRWSRPHVGLMNMTYLIKVRVCMKKGTAIFDSDDTSFVQVVDTIIEYWRRASVLTTHNETARVRAILLARKRHLMALRAPVTEVSAKMQRMVPSTVSLIHGSSTESIDVLNKHPSSASNIILNLHNSLNFSQNQVKLEHFSQSIGHDRNQSASPPVLEPNKLAKMALESMVKKKIMEQEELTPTEAQYHALAAQFLKKIPMGSEGALIMTAKTSEINKTCFAFVRLKEAMVLHKAVQVDIPLRYVVVLLLPAKYPDSETEFNNVFGGLFCDEVFRNMCAVAEDTRDLQAAVDDFIQHITAIPPGKLDSSLQLSPPEHPIDDRVLMSLGDHHQPLPIHHEKHHAHLDTSLVRTHRWFGGLIADFRRKKSVYLSDYIDAVYPVKNLLRIIPTTFMTFISQFVVLASFGVAYKHFSGLKQGVQQMFFGASICGIVYSLVSGQPLVILSATTPMLAFESLVFKLAKKVNVVDHWLQVRVWIALWTAILLVVTPFTEESFEFIVAGMFIYGALYGVMGLADTELNANIWHTPGNEIKEKYIVDPQGYWNKTCQCDNTSNQTIVWDPHVLHFEDFKAACVHRTMRGSQCDFLPDVFMFSIVLFILTFFMSISSRRALQHNIFPTRVRRFLSYFTMAGALISLTVLDSVIGLQTPQFYMPTTKLHMEKPIKIVNPFDIMEAPYVPAYALPPALFLSVMIFMEHQVCTVVVNRPENKLRKGHGYYLDLVVVSVLLIVSAIISCPFFMGQSKNPAPGEQPVHLGVREQRVTAFMSSVLLLIFFGNQNLIPQPVLYGCLLYIGWLAFFTSGSVLDRIMLLVIPRKHHPDLQYLRLIKLTRVHLYTLIQIVLCIIAFSVKQIPSVWVALTFPIMLPMFLVCRLLVLPRLYNDKELAALDHELPTWQHINAQPAKVHPANQHESSGN